MTCLVDMTCQILSHLVKLKGIQNQDSYILELYNTYNGQKSLIDEIFSNSQAYEYDYKSSASSEATKLSKLLFVFFTFQLQFLILGALLFFVSFHLQQQVWMPKRVNATSNEPSFHQVQVPTREISIIFFYLLNFLHTEENVHTKFEEGLNFQLVSFIFFFSKIKNKNKKVFNTLRCFYFLW